MTGHGKESQDQAHNQSLPRQIHPMATWPKVRPSIAREWKRANIGTGRLLTTPTRLLKLILPMPFHPDQEHINEPKSEANKREEKDATVEPLALLVHPQQPLSYLERLIQAEVPPIQVDGRERLPDIQFRAEADKIEMDERESKETDKKKATDSNSHVAGSNVASYSGLGREGPESKGANWVRWSSSTEVGDFIRDAARGKEFAIEIEGYPQGVRVAVPSFRDRTHYMRHRLRKMSKDIEKMAKIKAECDELAHKGAHRIAQGGFVALASWWGVVYYVTFHTEMGWDLVEPVTYLAGLTTIMGGYLWFLYMSKDLSYKAAMNITVSRRQNALYGERGVDLQRWEALVQEANHLRRDVKSIATEYDAEWDETRDLGEEIKEVLEKEKGGKQAHEFEEEEEEDGDGDDEAAKHAAEKKD